MKHIKLQVTKDKLIQHNITIFSGYYKLTDLEQRLLHNIIMYYVHLQDNIKDQALLLKNFLDSTHRTSIMEELSIKAPQLTSYLNSLKKKNVLKEVDGTYYIDQKFIPATKIVFEFNIIE